MLVLPVVFNVIGIGFLMRNCCYCECVLPENNRYSACNSCRYIQAGGSRMARKKGLIISSNLFKTHEYGVDLDTMISILDRMPMRSLPDDILIDGSQCASIESACRIIIRAMDAGKNITFESAERLAVMADCVEVLSNYHERVYGITDDMVFDLDQYVLDELAKKNGVVDYA